MSLWERLKESLALGRGILVPSPGEQEATPLQTLEAHLEAFLERYPPGVGTEASRSVPHKHDAGVSLSVLPAAERVVAVESGLSRIEVRHGKGGLRVSILADAFLPGWTKLGREKQQLFSEFEVERDERGHFVFLTKQGGPIALPVLARRIEVLLTEVLDHKHGEFYSVSIEAEREPDNAPLLESIRNLVKQPDLDSRRMVYQAFLNALVYVPLEFEAASMTAPGVRHWPASGKPKDREWAVFTDEEALTRARLGRDSVIVASGLRVARAAEAEGIVALKLNPRSKVGGEFLSNEVTMMCDYLRKVGVLR